MFWIALELSIPKIGLNVMLSLTIKNLDAFKFDGVAESDNTGMWCRPLHQCTYLRSWPFLFRRRFRFVVWGKHRWNGGRGRHHIALPWRAPLFAFAFRGFCKQHATLERSLPSSDKNLQTSFQSHTTASISDKVQSVLHKILTQYDLIHKAKQGGWSNFRGI